MSAFDQEDPRREIIIVKRRGGDDEAGHHGGVWKIAFADFMTAMMCFFLVMWLVNASTEETKAAIASYFNPMTLVDNTESSKGLDDPGESPQSLENSDSDAEKAAEEATNSMDQRSGPSQHNNSLDHAETRKTSDQHLFSNPYAVLAEIAAQTATLQNVSAKGDGGAQTAGPATGAQGGESYRDPFAPDFWSQEVASAEDSELDVFRQAQGGNADVQAEIEPAVTTETQDATEPSEALEVVAANTEEEATVAAAEDAPAAAPTATAEDEVNAGTQDLATAIREEIVEAFGRDSELNRTITVTAQADGVMISVTDELNYGMFEIGSAVPQGELVLAMEKIGQTLNEHTGRIRINGHTDGRPFRGENYDNWRLSSARAHAAYYMLVRGGVEEARVREVAGFADRELKIEDDPLADGNRRIEIFLETGG